MELGKEIRKDFPIFERAPAGARDSVYLDSAATSLKPKPVIDALRRYYEEYSANVHRGVYLWSEQATAEYEKARESIARLIGAARKEEIVFIRGATEALNLLAASYAGYFLREGEGILLSEMEHHANLVPWQEISRKKNLRLFFLPFDGERGELTWERDTFVRFLKERNIRLISLTHVSNVFGTINPVSEISARAHEAGAAVIIDAAQSVPHLPVDVRTLGADFAVFSGHKMLGPTGMGVLWGRYDMLAKMPPYQTGGEMIRDVMLDRATYQAPPLRFEAGTPHIAGAIGLGAAAEYMQNIGMEHVRLHEKDLLQYAREKLSAIPGMKILGPDDVEKRSGVVSFTIDGIHPHDIGSFLNEQGIMIRAGDHCAKPLHKKLKISASCRMSFHIYNAREDIDTAAEALERLTKLFNVKHS
mgnify:FL=1